MQQTRNLIITIVLCMVILAGWFWLEHQLWPRRPPEKKDKGPLAAKVWPKLTLDQKTQVVVTGLAAHNAPLALGADVHRLVADIRATFNATMPVLVKPSPLPVPWQNYSPEDKQIVAGASGVGTAAVSPLLAAMAQFILSPPAARAEDIVLKSDFIEAQFTTKGAGIFKLNLIQFRASDLYGHRTDKVLELIQEDQITPSFLMYHYPQDPAEPGKLASRPLMTLGTQIWNLVSSSPERVVFSTNVPDPDFKHVTITKTFTLGKKDYHIGLAIEIKDTRAVAEKEALPFRYQLAGAHGIPIEGEWYTSIFRNAVVGMVDSRNSLWRDLKDAARISHKEGGDRVPEGDRGDSFIQYAGVMNQFFAALIVVDNRQPKAEEGGVDMKNILAWARATQETKELKGRVIDVIGNTIRIDREARPFVMLPRAENHLKQKRVQKGDHVVVGYYEAERGRLIAAWVRPGKEYRPFTDDITVRVHSEPIELKPSGKVVHKFMLYHGPVKTMLLGQFTGEKAVDPQLVERYTDTLHLNTLTDYRSEGFIGAFAQTIRLTDLLIFVTKLMHWLLNLLHWIAPSYAITIILLTVIVRGMMFPISRRQAMMSIKMQNLAPEMKKIQEKFKNDPKARNEAVMELYRKNQVNPLGMCLPLFLQLPVFLGLYYCLQESIHFRLAGGGFLWWIDNLAAPDMLIWWGESIPWLSDPDSQGGILYLGPYLNLLPFFAVALMIVQQKMMTPPPTDEQQAMTQKMMKYMMIFFGIMFYKVAAGLCIYFTASSLWGLAERKLLPKKDAGKTEPPAQTGVKAGKPTPGGGGGKYPGAGPRTKPKAPPTDDGTMQKVRDWWQDILKKASKK